MPIQDKKLPSLKELQQKIDAAKGAPAEANPPDANPDLSLVMRFSVELLAGVVVGVLVGYLLDRWFGTLPLMSILCLFFGAAGGMLNVIRSGQKIDAQAAPASQPTTNYDDDKEP